LTHIVASVVQAGIVNQYMYRSKFGDRHLDQIDTGSFVGNLYSNRHYSGLVTRDIGKIIQCFLPAGYENPFCTMPCE
jgi:uncharacterized membrane protein